MAAREGIFTLSNTGHALFAVGIALTVSGAVLLVAGRAAAACPASGRRLMLRGTAIGINALAGVSLRFAAFGGSGLAGGHLPYHAGIRRVGGVRAVGGPQS